VFVAELKNGKFLERLPLRGTKKKKRKLGRRLFRSMLLRSEWFFSGICMDLKSGRVCVVVATNEKRHREFGSSSSQRKEKLKFFVIKVKMNTFGKR